MDPVIISLAVIGFTIGITIYYIYRQNQLQSTKPESSPKNKKPPKIYNVGKCGICFEDIEGKTEEISSILKCGHVYHDECLGELIKNQHKHCPQCREDVEFYNPEKSKCNDSTTIDNSPDAYSKTTHILTFT